MTYPALQLAPVRDSVTIAPLADDQAVLPRLQQWFRAEWPGHYGESGPGDATSDLLAYAGRETLPVGLVAYLEGEPCGFIALREEPLSGQQDGIPWVGAAYVRPELRRQGIGQQLFAAIEEEALRRGYRQLYCATATAGRLLKRNRWLFLKRVAHDGQDVEIFEKALA